MKRSLYYSYLALGLFLLSCDNTPDESISEETNPPTEDVLLYEDTTALVVEIPEPTYIEPADVEFQTSVSDGDYGPETEVSLKVGEDIHLIKMVMGTVNEYDSTQFEEMGIPADALTACGAWFAGGGEYFYAFMQEKDVVIYSGWLDEMVDPDEGYHWEEMKRIPA